MTLVQPKVGWHTGAGGGNLTGITSDYIIPVLAAGKNVTIVAADTAAGLYDAAVACQNYQNTTSVLCYRTTDQRSAGGFDFDALANNFAISPEENAALHWAAFEPTIPAELRPYKSSLELIILNEIRGKQTDELIYQGLHIGEYLGRFALAYRALTDWRLLFFGFASGEPEPDLWEQPSMLDLLRVCGERPYDTGLALHHYSYDVNNILANYPYLIGRQRQLFDTCTAHGIPWPRVVISEWGWTLDNVPSPTQALDDIDIVFRNEYGPFEQIAGAAIWWLGPGFGNIADKVQALIKPVGDYIVATDYEIDLEQQPTQPPDGGGGTVTEIKSTVTYGLIEGRIKVRPQRWDSTLKNWVATGAPIYLDLPAGTRRIAIDDEVEVDEPTDPNPPPVSNPLPQGALIVDVSYSNDVNLATLKANGVQGVIIRASNGIRLTDSSNAVGVDVRFWQHLEEATQLGMPWGAYHYCNENYDDVAQVQHFLSIIETAVNEGYPLPSLGLWLDFETPSNPAYAGAPTTEARIQALCTTLASLRPSTVVDYGVYTSKGWWDAKVPNAASWVPSLGLKAWAAAWVPASTLVNGWPPSWWHPSNLKGFTAVHFWQWTSVGGFEVGHSVDSLDLNYVGSTAVVPDKSPTPPAGQTVDLLAYMRGTHKQQHTLQYTWSGGGTQTVQNMHDGNEWKIVKGGAGEYEQLYYDDAWLYRAEDTSESQDRFYTHSTNGKLGAAWVKRHMAVGETVYTSKQVQHYLKAGCVPQNGGLVTDKLTLTAVYPSYTFASGITLPDVIRLEWSAGEGYLFAKGYGLVGFEFSGGKSYISELALSGRADLPISVPGCIDLSGRYYA